MEKIIFVILIVIVIGALFYAIHSQATHINWGVFKEIFQVPSFHLASSTSGGSGGGTVITGYSGNGNGSGGSNGTGTGTGPGSVQTSSIPSYEIPQGFTAAQLSPYFKQVTINGASAATLYNYGQITLASYFSNSTGTIDVTGWRIVGRNGNEYIPQAVNLYDPTGLAPASDIEMKSGDQVYLYSGSAPFNLRLNECSGYMANVANFVPAIPQTCPYINYSQLGGLSDACQKYIQSLNSCQAPNPNNPNFPNNDYNCENYIQNNFSYRSCFDQHENDPNFLSNQVWVWTGDNIVDAYHDQLELLDKNGLLVDIYSY